MPDAWSAHDKVTFALGSTGTVLGIVNTITSWFRSRIRVKVRASFALSDGTKILSGLDQGNLVCVDVANTGTTPIFVEEIGFTIPGQKQRLAIPNPITRDHKRLSRMLQPQQSVSGYSNDPRAGEAKGRAYVRLGNGKTYKGNALPL